MRRSYISPEYINNEIYGTYNMVEESNFFGAKMLEIEDKVNIIDEDIIWYQNINSEQLDFVIESTLDSLLFSSSVGKLNNHTLSIDQTQPQYQLDKNTKWILDINLEGILTDYLFATLKKFRTFEGLKKEMTLNIDVDVAIKSYIKSNVIGRYKFTKIDLYIDYKELRGQNLLRYKNIWKPGLTTKFTKIQTETSFDLKRLGVTFNQEKPSQDYIFEYYFDITFEKI